MDPVSRIILDRERQTPRLTPFVVLALSLHGLVVAAAFFAGRVASARPPQLPAVSVRIVRPQPRPEPRQRQVERRQPATRPTAAPEPSKVPAAKPPEPADADDRRSASADAMPEVEARRTPQPVAPPEIDDSAEASRGGLSLAGGDSRGPPAIPSDFQFTYYVERMLALIESRWYKPPVSQGTRARIRFRILRDGRLEGIQLEAASQVPSFDRSALRALYAANPLPPLPPAYRKPSLTVHLTFSE